MTYLINLKVRTAASNPELTGADFLSALEKTSAAFAPYRKSSARSIGIKDSVKLMKERGEVDPELAQTVDNWSPKSNTPEAICARLLLIEENRKNSRINKMPKAQPLGFQKVIQLLQEKDDDGVAIFWKEKRFEAESIGYFHSAHGDVATSVKVVLQEREAKIDAKIEEQEGDDGARARFAVLTGHLGSGEGMKNELKRIKQVEGKGISSQYGEVEGIRGIQSHNLTIFSQSHKFSTYLLFKVG